nr:PfmaC [Starmerella bombicola]
MGEANNRLQSTRSAGSESVKKIKTTLRNVLSPFNSQPQYDPEDPEQNKEIAAVEKTDEVRARHWYDGFVRLVNWYPGFLPKEEKWLLFKLDVILLLYVCSSYFTKALDKGNLVKAYNSDMDKDLNFTGDDLSYAKSLYSAGYIVSMCFGMLLVTRPWARLMLPVLETIWGVLTFCEAAVTTSSQMFALRFLIGFAEGPIFPSVIYTIGSWYKRDELYRRIMAFGISAPLGSIFSGFLQKAAFYNLGGKGGLTGWQWGFIIDGIFTVPIALLGFAFYPGSLEQSGKVWWLRKDQKELAKTRMRESGVRRSSVTLSWSLVRRVFGRWHVHYFAAFWVLVNVVALPDGTGFDLWLKAGNYNESQRVNYPSIQSAVGIVAQFILAGLADTFSPYLLLTIVQCLFIISYSSLTAWNIPVGWRWVCFMIIGLDTTNQTLVSGQINRSVRRDADERAVVIGFSDAVSQAMNIWTNIVFFPTSQAPKFHRGYIASLVGAILMLFLPILHFFGDRYDAKLYAREDLEFIEGRSLNGDSVVTNEVESIGKKKPIVDEASVHGNSSLSDSTHQH